VIEFLRAITWREIVEILLISLGVFFVLRFLRGTRGLGILKGVVVLLASLYLLLQISSRAWDLANIPAILKAFLTGSLLLIIVVFQPELRRAFNRLGRNPLVQFFIRARSEVVENVCRAAAFLASERSGALIVLTRQHGLGHVIDTGVPLDADVTSELLCTIFHPGAQLHDMAAVIRHDRVAAARCRLPLSENPALARRKGTRHLAGVGISEESDAVAVVISEETGRISVAVNGQLFEGLSPSQLEAMLTALLTEKEISPAGVPAATPIGSVGRPGEPPAGAGPSEAPGGARHA
jgi:diadenylate cyclase